MTDGTEQRERMPAALAGDYFQVDETSFGQLVAMGERFASHLKFHDEHGPTTDTWATLYETDELLAMASILGYDPAPLKATLFDDFDGMPERRIAVGVLELATVLDGWYRKLQAMNADGARAVAGTIALAVDRQLADDMVWLGGKFASPTWAGEVRGYAHGKLEAMWLRRSGSPRQRNERTDRELLRGAFFALLDTVARTKEAAAARMEESRKSRRHDPAAGLLAGFLQLFQGVQRHINGFTARHTDFYYRDVLEMQPRRAEPDHVHLVFEPLPRQAREVVVRAGTAFSAGKDASQKPVEFVAESDLVVTDVKVQALCSLRLERAWLLLGEDDRFDCVKRIRADKPASIQALPGAAPAYWPLFGGTQAQGVATIADADIGIAIASNMLLLKEGLREIHITLGLHNTVAGGGLWGHMADGNADVQWQFVRALPQLFSVSFTTEAGWMKAHDCFVSRVAAAKSASGLDSLEVTVRLRPELPGITGCVPAIHGAQFNTALPIVRIGVRQDAAMCAYSLLDSLQLEEVTIAVDVRGARDLSLSNQLGRLDASTPFMPFGPMPAPGAYLVFGSAEAAAKPVTQMRLNVQWGNLPQGPGGFAEHYDGYDSDYDDAKFKARVSVLQEGAWRASPVDPQGRPLFHTGAGGKLAISSRIAVSDDELKTFYRPSTLRAGEPFVYDVASRGGFFRVELREPAAGFGHAEYPQVLTRVVSANARRKKPETLPRAPYTPVIERITLDYRAASTIRIGDGDETPGEVFHLHPFGTERIHPGANEPRGVLPVWENDGNLFIGLSGTDAQGTLSLLFELRGESAVPLLDREARVTWSYLRGDRWVPLGSAQVLADSTAGFLTSGIVMLDLPGDIDLDHAVMPPGLFWLRVSADRDYDSFAGLYSVRAQAVCAVRSGKSPVPQDYQVLAAGSVAGPVVSIPGLARTTQAGPSFGMRPAESDQQLRIRTGERLKHKSRAQLPWDFERLVLERFPSVFKVRCFPNLRAPDASHSPGSVMIVVVPALGGEEQFKNVPGPRLNAIELRSIEEFLCAQASPFAHITVRNATYERIQVRCSVGWKRGANAGYCERRLSQALFDFLSPWNDNGYRARFEWTVRREDIEAHIREQPDVAFVTGVSLIHVAASDSMIFTLDDTARPEGAAAWDRVASAPLGATVGAIAGSGHAHARWPWSIAVPMRTHLIDTIASPADAKSSGQLPTGVGLLGVGSTFIVAGMA